MINLGAIVKDLISLRRKTAQDFLTFRKYYFAHYHSVPDGAMQKELSKLLSRAVNKRGSKLAIAAPRGFAKSTLVSLEFVIYCICFKLEGFIVIVSATQSQATNFLRDIKREFETNEKLRNDFPDVSGVDNKSVSQRWSETEIITANDIKVLAISTGQQIRGRRHGEKRPTLIILDDIGTSETARNPESTYNLETWLTTDALKAGDKTTNIIFVGTIHHPNSLLGKYTDPKQIPGWTTRIYKAIISYAERVDLWGKWSRIYLYLDIYNGEFGPEAAKKFFHDHKEEMLKGVKLLWPDRLSYYDLMAIREQEGYPSFDSEYQNEPINPRDCVFNVNSLHYWDNEFESREDLLQRRRQHLLIYGACDPSLGKDRESGDFSAIVNVAIDCTRAIVYVLDVDVARRTPDDTINTIIQYGKVIEYTRFAFETNQFQEVMAKELDRRAGEQGCCLVIEKVNNTANKQVRIEQLQPLFNSGKIQISKRHRALIEEMRFYPKGAHDDILDALEMAVRVAFQKSHISRGIIRSI
jgi:predicted phage terminase large subunit-like protein